MKMNVVFNQSIKNETDLPFGASETLCTLIPVRVDRCKTGVRSQWHLLKEALIKSNYFRLVKIVRIIPEDRGNRITITTHFVEYTNNFPCA